MCLKVIPVIDVLNGIVVHAVRGNRSEYKPLQSVLSPSVDAIEVATAFKLHGFSTLYLADIDAIQGKTPAFDFYSCIVQMGFDLMVDVGVTDVWVAKNLINCGVSKVIVGTETLQSKVSLQKIVAQVGTDKIIVSFDVKNDKVLTHPVFDGSTDLLELFETFQSIGVSEFMLLDLTRVGSNEGVNAELLKKCSDVLDCGIYVGGGIRSVDDLLKLKELNVLGVLFATALHLGNINIKDLTRLGLL